MNAADGPGRFGTAFDRLGVERAWTRTRGHPDVLIGIVDRGIQRDHPLLAPNIRRDFAHHAVGAGADEMAGTHAAGIAAGTSSEAEGFSGVAPDARLLPVRFTMDGGAPALDLAHAIEYAVEMGACIVNVSHAGDLSLPCVLRAFQYAATRNVLVVCSSAQTRQMTDEAAPNLLCVLSVDEQRRPMHGSVTGAGAHLAAPGFAHVPCWRAHGHMPHADMSLGAPYVSGCAALIKARNPAWGYYELKEHLLASGTAHDELEGHCQTGRALHVGDAVVGPLELEDPARSLTWSSLNDAEIRWTLRYRSPLCANVVALFRAQGSEHWRELAHTRARESKLAIPAEVLRRGTGTLRIACRDSNFHADDIELTVL